MNSSFVFLPQRKKTVNPRVSFTGTNATTPGSQVVLAQIFMAVTLNSVDRASEHVRFERGSAAFSKRILHYLYMRVPCGMQAT
jgi:hypothetical protein